MLEKVDAISLYSSYDEGLTQETIDELNEWLRDKDVELKITYESDEDGWTLFFHNIA